MAESLGVEPREVREMESRLTGHDMAFDPAAEADDDSAFQSPANYLEDHRYDPARQLEDADWSDNSNTNLHEALQVLDDRSRDILYQRWLAEEKATLQRVGREVQRVGRAYSSVGKKRDEQAESLHRGLM